MPAPSTLDSSELFHLALESARRDDHGAAITYLKRALDLPEGATASASDYARMLYLLGAEYAQIGLMDRAQEHMRQALELAPALHAARFQLGLLLITQALPDQAIEVLAPFQSLGEHHMFFHFRAGLEHLVRDEFEPCKESLLKGMKLNETSPEFNSALNGDIQKLLNALPEAGTGNTDEPQPAVEAGFAMSAYNRGGNTH